MNIQRQRPISDETRQLIALRAVERIREDEARHEVELESYYRQIAIQRAYDTKIKAIDMKIRQLERGN